MFREIYLSDEFLEACYMQREIYKRFGDFKSYVCWILSRKHYGKNKKYRHR